MKTIKTTEVNACFNVNYIGCCSIRQKERKRREEGIETFL
jgi:hypothetical protein